MNSNKVLVMVLSDPLSGTDESLGRLFNALTLTYELRNRGDEVAVVFQGVGTRWPAVLQDSAHPAHNLFNLVSESVLGMSHGCAVIFGAGDAPAVARLDGNKAPGTEGVTHIGHFLAEGYRAVTY